MRARLGPTFLACSLLIVVARPARADQLTSWMGTVRIQPAGGAADSEGAPIAEGATRPLPVSPGSVIRTSGNGRAELELGDGSRISLSAGSSIRVASESGDAPSLDRGRARVRVPKLLDPGRFKLRSRAAVMGVRGTEFIVDTSTGATAVCSLESEVEVNSRVVTPRTGVIVTEDGSVSDPVPMDPLMMQWWRQETDVVSDTPLGFDWHWIGPPSIDYWDPTIVHGFGHRAFGHVILWGRALFSTNLADYNSDSNDIKRTFTPKLALRGGYAPHRSLLLFAEGAFVTTGGTTAGVSTYPKDVELDEGYVLWRPRPAFSVSLGRQEWHFGEGLILGRNTWDPLGNRTDGALVALKSERWRLRLFGGRLADAAAGGWQGRLAGAYLDGAAWPVDVYSVWAGSPGSSVTTGGRFRIEPSRSRFFVSEELAFQAGSARSSFLVSAEAGAHLVTGTNPVDLKFQFLQQLDGVSTRSSVSAPSIATAPDTHRFLGLAGALNLWGEVRKVGIGGLARWRPAGRPLAAQLDILHFDQPRGGLSVGDEVDLQLSYEPHPEAFLQLGIAAFSPGESFAASQQSPAFLTFLMAQYRY